MISRYSDLAENKTMLIKNNNNHRRILHLSEYFDNSYFLLLFRNPLSQSRSLLNQHINFLNIYKKDNYISEYMNLIGHYEFGPNIRPFFYDNFDPKWYKESGNLSIDYWLGQWIETYSWILKNKCISRKNVYLISYENLCSKKNLY